MCRRRCFVLVVALVVCGILRAQGGPTFVPGQTYTLQGYLTTTTALDPDMRDKIVVPPTKSVSFQDKPLYEWQSWAIGLAAASKDREVTLVKLAEAVGGQTRVTVAGTWEGAPGLSGVLRVRQITVDLCGAGGGAVRPTGAAQGTMLGVPAAPSR